MMITLMMMMTMTLMMLMQMRRASSLKGAGSGLRGPMLEALPKPNVEALFQALAQQAKLRTILGDAKKADSDAKTVANVGSLLFGGHVACKGEN